MRNKLFLLIIFISFIISSCVYYNTFYNAEKYFKTAQEMELNDDGRPSSNAIQNYNKVIKKCGMVLEYYEGSKYSDDALLLMAKAFFYIGRNYTQTISTLEDMIKFYPDSELVPEARLYLARAKYEFRQEEVAYDLLKEFLLDENVKDHHPQALKILADYKLREKDNVLADYYLNRLIEDYPDSDEYEEAFFLQGKSQNEVENYQKSNQIFFDLLKSRVSRKTKFDARYYIAVNYLLSEDYQLAATQASKLLKDEYRENKITRIRLIQARSFMELDKIDDAIAILEAIMEDNKRSGLSASASFFLGQIYFHKLKDYSTAIEFYNKVKTEDRDSEYLERSVSQSAIASQIIQYYNPTSKISAEELINQQFKLAEFYIEYLDMPDSALIVYNDIIGQEKKFQAAIDSLQIQLDSLFIKLDSLTFVDTLSSSDADSTEVSRQDDQTLKINLQAEYDSKKTLIDNAHQNISLYQNEFIPFAKLTKLWLYKKVLIDSAKVEDLFHELQDEYPENKYTFAAEQFLAGKDSILITTRKKISETAEYSSAIKTMQTEPEKTVALLTPIAQNFDHEHRYQALYSLGYINYFVLEDSLNAKAYFDSVLAFPKHTDFKTEISKFYDGENFIKIDRLPFIEQILRRELEETSEEETEEKSTDEEVIEEKIEEPIERSKVRNNEPKG